MSGGRGTSLRRSSALALYALFLVTAPFAHHDLVCHVKTPFHCTSCTSSVVGSDPQLPAGNDACELPDAGRVIVQLSLAQSTLLTVRSTGRSPPLV